VLPCPLPFFWTSALALVAGAHFPGEGALAHLQCPLLSLLLNLVLALLELCYFMTNLGVEWLARRCSWRAPPLGLVVAAMDLHQVFRPLQLLVKALWKFFVGWLLWMLRGPELRSLALDLQPRALFLASS
jgi:hypothetical protein